MGFAANIPLFSIVLCLLCAVISSLLRARTAWRVSMALCAAVALGSAALLICGTHTGTNTEYWMGHYPHPWGNELRFGILEPLLALVFSLVILLSILGGRKQQEADLSRGKGNFYYIMCDLALCALLALAYTDDIFTGYVFIEISTIAACGLLMIREIGRTTLAAIRYMIFALIGSGLFLLGVILLYAITGHLLMPELRETVAKLRESGEYRTVLVTSVALITIGLSVKSGMFPFHFWMPDTYGYATPASASILSGVISKGYIFFLIKLIFRVFGQDLFYGSGMNEVLYLLGAAGVIVGSIAAAREKDVFRMIAYSSAAQIGYIFMGIGISPAAGCLAALFHILAHAVTKPMLFLSGAQISDAACGDGNEADAIARERRMLGHMKAVAQYMIDTSHLTTAQLKEQIVQMFLDSPDNAMTVQWMSFGYKYGVPLEADLMLDVRCFRNPFYAEDLKHKTGLDAAVQDFVCADPAVAGFEQRLYDLVDYMLPLYRNEGKSRLVIAVGCAGGEHLPR